MKQNNESKEVQLKQTGTSFLAYGIKGKRMADILQALPPTCLFNRQVLH